MFRSFGRCFDRYDQMLRSHPIRTKLCTGLCLTSAGDYTAQSLANRDTEQRTVWDKERTGRQLCWTVCGLPIMHFWYNFLHYSLCLHCDTGPQFIVYNVSRAENVAVSLPVVCVTLVIPSTALSS